MNAMWKCGATTLTAGRQANLWIKIVHGTRALRIRQTRNIHSRIGRFPVHARQIAPSFEQLYKGWYTRLASQPISVPTASKAYSQWACGVRFSALRHLLHGGEFERLFHIHRVRRLRRFLNIISTSRNVMHPAIGILLQRHESSTLR